MCLVFKKVWEVDLRKKIVTNILPGNYIEIYFNLAQNRLNYYKQMLPLCPCMFSNVYKNNF